MTKLETRLRRSARPPSDHQHGRTPITAVAATPDEILTGDPATNGGFARHRPPEDEREVAPRTRTGWAADDGGPGRVVRVKDHPAEPITVDAALLQMELVGHDFYLFNDAESGRRLGRVSPPRLRLRPAPAELAADLVPPGTGNDPLPGRCAYHG